MNMFIVYADGVYRHQIVGIFSSVELAKIAAVNEALKEYDGYHKFVVAESRLDEYVEDVTDLFSIGSESRVMETYDYRSGTKYDPRPLSRNIVMYNKDHESVDVIMQMTKELELVK